MIAKWKKTAANKYTLLVNDQPLGYVSLGPRGWDSVVRGGARLDDPTQDRAEAARRVLVGCRGVLLKSKGIVLTKEPKFPTN